MKSNGLFACLAAIALSAPLFAAHTNNILITGYWPPTNEMVRQFSTSPTQNPSGWVGGDWEGRGYDIYSYFPEFPNGVGQGVGDLEVDYQDTSEDFWRIANEVQPVAIITFSRGRNGRNWEVEGAQRNLATWVNDYTAPFQPTPSPPDSSVPAGFVRPSTLPMQDIVDRLENEFPVINPFIDPDGYGGGFLSEFIAYHGVWYQSLHSDPTDPAWSVAAGHIHVGINVTTQQGIRATEITLRTLLDYVDTIVPEPTSFMLMAPLALLALRRR
ncbi:MAG: hypothetical protein KDA32_03610 [Phycisphaerales bacterium]|nr:hypothetical protein [Phycisphaerales bacterium]